MKKPDSVFLLVSYFFFVSFLFICIQHLLYMLYRKYDMIDRFVYGGNFEDEDALQTFELS